MILAFDTYYFEQKAKTVCISFENWSSANILETWSETLYEVSNYESGNFYKRELPCIVSLFSKVHFSNIEAIVIDGFVFLDDNRKLGLGGHLFEHLNNKIPIIGVAKTNFAVIHHDKKALLRGQSIRPLYVTAIGINLDQATEHIRTMHGKNRLPTLLKQLDSLTKSRLLP